MRSVALTFVIALAVLVACLVPAQAQNPGSFFDPRIVQSPKAPFDHTKTGFPLTGAHVQAQCESCHIAGRFKSTPQQCFGCHNGAVTSGMSINHPRVTDKCEACHITTRWSDIITIDHTQIRTVCAACHNGLVAIGKPKWHIPTTAPCEMCHKTTVNFNIAVRMDHTGITGNCASCHNNITALGKPPTHVATDLPCETCHKSFITFAGAIYAHQPQDINCSTCHNGSAATGMRTPPHIPVTGVECSACHVNTSSTFATYAMNHPAVGASRCDACHNGAYTGEGTAGAQGTASYANHIAVAGRDCVTCHPQAAANFTSWAGARYSHQATDTDCASCHNGTMATGLKTPPHVPVSGVQCSNCHTNTSSSFASYVMYHGAVSASRCDSCHNGAYTSEGTNGALGTASYAGHVATSGRDCLTCHASAAATFTSWSGAIYTHAATDTNCSNCHNGTTATGHTTPPHIPVTGVQCSACHTNTATSFVTYTMDHASVSASRCDACHNGAYTGEGTKGALGTASYAGHVATSGRDCATCHAAAVSGGFVTFAGATYQHAATDTNCSNCHNGTTATGHTTPPHVPVTGVQCSNCHSNTASSFAAYTMNHASVSAMRCDACHNGAYAGQGTKGALGSSSFPNHVAVNGRDCLTCHASAAASFTTWAGAGYVHAASDTNCSSCHNGSAATGLQTPPHIPTGTVQCSGCHVNTAPNFSTYTMNHSVVSGARCDACHNGAYTGEGTTGALGSAAYPNHVAVNGRDCVTCHAAATRGFTTWAGAAYSHQATDTNCSTCHNGTTATGMTNPPHVPVVGVQCSACHVNTASSFTTYTMNHASVGTSRCDSCHNGLYTSEGTKGALGSSSYAGHLPTNGRDCQTCHTSASSGFTTWAGALYSHAASDTNCSNCHNGTTATGHTTPPHVPVTGVQCSNCHVNTASSFTTYTMNHASVSASRCDACHNGSFTSQGTNGALGTSSYPNHVAVAGRDCVTCHASAAASFTSWAGAAYSHSATDANCSSCHNGTTATGMTTPPHIPSASIQCSSCHANTSSSFTAYTMNHAASSTIRCDVCHSGFYTSEGTKGALGTSSYAGHVATNGRDCATCHAAAVSGGYVTFAGAVYSHAATDTNCSNCHNGTTATGNTTPPHIPVTGVQCSNCHVNTAASFVTYTMNHASVSASRCDACHNGSFTSQGTKGAFGTTSYSGHVATTGRDCVTCHAAAVSGGYVTFAGALYSHAATDTNCSNCHNGTTATGHTTPPHIPVTGVQCSNCHVNTATSFVTYTMNHASVSATRCDACHNGSYLAEGTKGALGTASYPNHVAVAGRDCATCHASAAASFTSWAGGAYAHAAGDTNCSSCHNGTTATGMKTPPHIPTGTVQCSGCHVNTSANFTTYTMNHGVVSGSRCDACHNGSYTAEGTKGALGASSYPNHVAVAGRDCVTCHAAAISGGYVSFAGAAYLHAASDTNCTSCHNGTTALGMKTPPHIPTAGLQCSGCHVNTAASFTTYTMNHSVSSAIRCDACHNGSYTSEGTKGAYGTAAYAGHVATSGRDCVTCHAAAVSGGYATFAGATYQHAATDTNCSNCHNGTTATGHTTPPHIPVTGVQCSNCHVNTATSFATYTMNHASVSAARCDACHNGTYTNQGTKGALGTASYSGHVATTGRDCVTCHAAAVSGGYVTFAGATYQHAATDTNCSNCHNGTTATGHTTPPHIPVTGVQCSNCHVNTATSFVTYTMNHVSVSATRCDACHNGSFTSQGTKGATGTAAYANHVAVAGRDCATCHASAAASFTSWAGGTYAHAAGDTNCSSCHNGTTALGMKTPPHIPTGTVQCSGCHVNTAASFITYTMNHGVVSGSRCDACHNGSYAAEGTKGALGAASYPNHVALAGRDCLGCHASAAAGFTGWSGGTYPHAASDTNCSSCHNGSTALGLKTPPHVPVGAVQCANCHVSSAASFSTYTMNHASVGSSRCDACHNGSYTAEGTKGALGAASYPNHVALAGRDCLGCHASAAAGFTGWSGGTYPHAASDTNCSSCHNGTTATGMKTPPHIPTAALQCSGCHVSTATSFTTYTMNHSVSSAMRCDACHSGSYLGEGTKGALGTVSYSGHVATAGRDCVTCHAKAVSGGYVSFAGAIYTHAATDTNCSNCHNGATATGHTTPPHVPVTGVQCSNCHTSAATSFITYTMNHASVSAARCDACHNGSFTAEGTAGAQGTASYPNHVAVAGRDCITCHASAAVTFKNWAGGLYTHAATDTNCSSCHNNATATGMKTPPHIPTAAIQCSGCHVNTAASFTTYTMNHSVSSAMRCDACHNGSYATEGAKGALGTASYTNHVATNGQDCAACHASAAASFTSWSGGTYTHAASDTNCSSCHNGAIALGMKTPPHIPATGVQCSNCHSNTSPSFTAYTMNHVSVSAARCDSCHNGSYTGEGTKGAFGTAAYPNHVPVAGRDCVTCHASAVSGGYVSFAGGAYTHSATDTNCSSCHNGTTALGLKTPPHIPTAALQCSGCHVNTAASFTTYTMNHTVSSAMRCDACHNGSYLAEGTKGALGTVSFPNHVAAAGRDCSVCHAKAASGGYVSFAGATYTHTATDTNCSSCHNGTTATGLKTPPHIPTAALQCSGCHVNTAASFTTYTMNHTVSNAMRCDACHNGSYLAEGTKGALGTVSYSGHVATAGKDCATCHAKAVSGGYVSFAGGTYTHAATDTNCSSCHNGATATGMTTPPHIPTAALQCSGCHVNTAVSFTTYTMNHNVSSAMRCDACHNGSYLTQGTKGALGTASYNGHVPTNGGDCATCHAKAVSGGYVSFAGGTYTHAATDTNCSSCHDGTKATGMTTPPHIPTAAIQCSGCHVNTAVSFTTYTMNHNVSSAMRCDACHSGSYLTQGTKGALGTASYPGHAPTNGNDCAACHAKAVSGGYVSFAGGTYNHAATDTNCSSCHNGTKALGMTTPPHISTGTVQCSGCHVNTAASFTTYTMSHSVVSGTRCDACHNGSYLTEGTKGALGTVSFPNHVAVSGRDCNVCHANAAATFTSWAGGSYAHAATDTNCSSCHNGTTATGLTTPPHIPTGTVQCSGCHVNTASSFTTYTMSHSVVSSMRCDACHNGSYTTQGTTGATGTASYPNHVAVAGRDCITCHASAASGFTSWANGTYAHAATDTNCSSCHNGSTAQGMTTPPHIPSGTVQCSGCHVNSASTFNTYTMNHSVTSTMRCDACHGGAYISQGTKGAYGTSSYTGHVATNGNDCVTCHAAAVSGGYVSFAGAVHVHAATDTNCVSCHNGTTATGHTTPPHIPSGTIQCSNCHVNTATSFVTYTMSHTAVTAMRCDACHDGTYTSQGTKGASGTSSYAGHVPTAGKDCVTCHATAKSGGYVSWSGGTYTHAATDTNCSSCHNGTTAQGLTTPPHIPVTGIQCSGCHVNTAASFTTYTMGTTGHAAVHATRCDTCHNGSYTSQGTKGASGPDHGKKSVDCGCCHVKSTTNFSSWSNPQSAVAGCTTTAKSITRAAITVKSLISAATGKPAPVMTRGVALLPPLRSTITPSANGRNAGVTPPSAAAGQSLRPTTLTGLRPTIEGPRMVHATAHGPCSSCHDGRTAAGKPAKHLTTTAPCESCHKSTTSFAGARFTHSAVTAPCATCHDGKTVSGKPAKHVTTTAACDSCHKSTTSFAGARFTHTAVTAPCATCHDGKTVSGKPAKHLTTMAPCESCHKSTTSFAGARFTHTAVTAPCATCHDGHTAAGKPAKHVTTAAACDSCHKSTRTFAGAQFSHASSTAACATCHDGHTAAGKPAKHVTTAAACDSCHKSTRTFAGARFTHTSVTAACATCHDGKTASGKPAKHLTTTAACDSCHKSTATFVGARFSHTSVTAPCATCHNGVTATGKPPRHVATTAACESCHRMTTTFGVARFNHADVAATRCATCHNGRDAPGKPLRHFLTNAPCEDCHKSTITFGSTGPGARSRGM